MKQIIVARADLKMSKGKMAAQVAHASVDAVLRTSRAKIDQWLSEGQKKIVLRADSEKELFSLFAKAKAKGIVSSLIRDAGHTHLEPDTTTCVGIGPDNDELVDSITRHLRMIN